ncbi:MAG: transglutaminase domain-containing protein, partial [Lentisphaeria bacterium]|nr:transglutaminase domain-containing protein [Lentisphaeria bacterium]
AGRTVYEWSATDQPAVVREDALPPAEAYLPTLFLTTGSWKQYARSVYDALDRAADAAPQARALARETVRGAADAAEKVRRIRDLVSKRIRTVGPQLDDAPLSVIGAADVTLRDGYGNSADVAALLCALLREAGFRPRFVLASRLPRIDALEEASMASPATGMFPAVLVEVNVRGLGTLFLNDTDHYAILGASGHDGFLGLSLPGGTSRRIAALADMSSRRHIEVAMRLDADGSAVVERTVFSFGDHFAQENRRFSEMPPEERRRYFQQALAGLAQAAEPVEELETDFRSHPGRERLHAAIPHFAVRDGDYLYFSLVATLGNLLGLRADERISPLYRPGPTRLRITTHIRLPREYPEALLLPGPLFWNAPANGGTVWIGVRQDEDGSIRLVHEADLKPAIYPPSVYDTLLSIHRDLTHPSAGTVLLRRGE